MTGIVSPPAPRYKEDAQLIAFWNQLRGSRSRAARRAGGRHHEQHPARRQLQRQRHPRRGLRDGAGRVADLSLQRVVDLAWLLRGDDDPAASAAGSSRASDDERAPKVLIIDERLAQRFWKGADPIGRRMWKPGIRRGTDARARAEEPLLHGRRRRRQHPDDGLTEKEPVGTYYFPFAQNVGRGMTLVTRTAGEPVVDRRRDPAAGHGDRSRAAVLRREADAAARRRIAGEPADADAAGEPVRRRSRCSSRRSASTACWRIQVAQRRKEIGIRMALGSDGRRIFGLIVTEGLWLLALGVARRPGRRVRDPARDGDAAVRRPADGSDGARARRRACSALVAFLACAVPARRAARIDPLIALTDQ